MDLLSLLPFYKPVPGEFAILGVILSEQNVVAMSLMASLIAYSVGGKLFYLVRSEVLR